MADTLSKDTYNMQGSQLMATLNNGASAKDHEGDARKFAAELASLKPHMTTPADRRDYAAIQQAFARWQGLDTQAMAFATGHNRAKATALVTGAANDATDKLATHASQLATLISKEGDQDASSSKSSATLITIVLGLVGVALAIAIVLLLSRRIVGGIRQMLKAAKALAQGDVDQHVDVKGRDEIAEMGRAFGEVIEYLHETAGAAGEMGCRQLRRRDHPPLRARRAAQRLRRDARPRRLRRARHLRHLCHPEQLQPPDGLHHRGGGSRHRRDRRVRQPGRQRRRGAGPLRRPDARHERGGRAGQPRVRRDRRGDRSGRRRGSRLRRGRRAGRRQGRRGHARGPGLLADVSAAIRELGDKSSRIGGIVDTITGIAEQTNLLALNAAIEAARAGESGKGFAVVAEEVRKLAEESQQAAASISHLVSEIRSETERAVTVVEHGVRQTDEGAQTVIAAREAFQQIRENVESMTERIEQIAASSTQIVDSATRMAENVSSVANVAEESSASTEQVSAATEETSASTQQIASSAQELSATADELQRLVSQFTLS